MAGSWREEDKGSSTSQSGWQATAWLTPVECACGPGSRMKHWHTQLDALLTRLNPHYVPGKQTFFGYADVTWNWPVDRVSSICIAFPVFWTLRCNYWIILGSPSVKVQIIVFLSDLRSKPFEAGDLMRAHWQLQHPFSVGLLVSLLLIFMPRISTHFLLISFLSCPSNHTDTPAPAVPNLLVLI